MADKSVGELIAATSVTPTDLFVLEQNGTAKKLTGQILENWLVSFADGHGGIQSITKLSTSGLADTYRITLADTTTFDFVVTNGRGISSIAKTSTSGLVDTYTITFNDGTKSTFTVTNGAKGDPGDNAYVWIKYASQEPTESSHSFGDVPDDWIGVYFGFSSTAPTDWQEYVWYKIKGEQGDPGNPATLASSQVTYQMGDSGTIIPSGTWSSSIPVVTPGKYLWTRQVIRFNTGDPITTYSVARFGIDGSGAVSTVAGIAPDSDGNVPLTAGDVGALPDTGGDLTGELKMNGQPISGLNPPVSDDQAANKGYVDTAKTEAVSYANEQVKKAAHRDLLDNSDFTNPVNQRGSATYTGAGYTIDRWNINANIASLAVGTGCVTATASSSANGFFRQPIESKLLFGKTLTFAVKVKGEDVIIASGTYPTSNPTSEVTVGSTLSTDVAVVISAQTNNAAVQIRVNSGKSVSLEWAALYEGKYTAETLPEYQPKGYGAELAECQRYYYRIPTSAIFSGHLTTGAVDLVCLIDTPCTMRIVPTVTFASGKLCVRTVSGYSTVATSSGASPSSVTATRFNARMLVTFTFGSALGTNNTPCTAWIVSGALELSADL